MAPIATGCQVSPLEWSHFDDDDDDDDYDDDDDDDVDDDDDDDYAVNWWQNPTLIPASWHACKDLGLVSTKGQFSGTWRWLWRFLWFFDDDDDDDDNGQVKV